MYIVKTIILQVLVLSGFASPAELEQEVQSGLVHVLDRDATEIIKPEIVGYPDIRRAYFPPGLTPMFAYYPSPRDDGTFLTVTMEKYFGTGTGDARIFALRPRVDFYLYTKRNADTPIKIDSRASNKDAIAAVFNPEAPLKILCHGFLSSYQNPFPSRMKTAYLNLEYDLNVILVDWESDLGWMGYYPEAARDTEFVGEEVAFLLQALMAYNFTELSKVHYVGHSLGAQAGGAAAFYLAKNQTLTKEKMDRITGLDPAGPLFCDVENMRLSADDAVFVDVIHTDDGLYCQGWWPSLTQIMKGKWGSKLTLGTANFYPNGGEHQRGCDEDVLLDTCSHSISYYYMEESLNGTKTAENYVFKGCRCRNYIDYLNACPYTEFSLMGEYASRKAKGKFYLRAGKKYPYSFVPKNMDLPSSARKSSTTAPAYAAIYTLCMLYKMSCT